MDVVIDEELELYTANAVVICDDNKKINLKLHRRLARGTLTSIATHRPTLDGPTSKTRTTSSAQSSESSRKPIFHLSSQQPSPDHIY
jgi:hypothetical protein